MTLPSGPYNPNEEELKILKYWLDNKFYKPEYNPKTGKVETTEEMKETIKREKLDTHCNINPPPNAYARPHLGNISGYAYQDSFARYARLKGKKTLLFPGKDHAAQQAEAVYIRDVLAPKGKKKSDYSREEFYKMCYDHFTAIMKIAREDEQRVGLSSDFDRDLFTLDPEVVNIITKTFIDLFEDKMVYKGVRIVNWCPHCNTALADLDTERKERETDFTYINYPLKKKDDLKNLKVIVFDLNKVLFDTGREKKYKAIAKKLGFNDPEKLRQIMTEMSSTGSDMRLGKLKPEEFWKEVGKKLELEISDYKELQELWLSFYSIYPDVLDYIKELKENGYKLALMSNTDAYRTEYLENKYDFLKYFDYKFFSYEEGLLKPDKKAFQTFEQKYGFSKDEILLIDDNVDNINATKEFNWNTYHYQQDLQNLKTYILSGQKFISVATTRPETMLGDTAVIVDPSDERYKDLIGETVILPLLDREIPIISNGRVDKEFGTGAVKLTPAHAPDDYIMMIEWNEAHPDKKVGYINVIWKDSKMVGPIGKYKGMNVEECRDAVIVDLKSAGLILKTEKLEQSVVVCERCKTIIEPIMSSQWFVDTDNLKAPGLEALNKNLIHIHPDYMTKKLEAWLTNLRDWPISRSIWWGYRFPVWYKGEVTDYTDENGQVRWKIGEEIIDSMEEALEKGLMKIQIPNPDSTRIDVIRHGETDYTNQKRCIGRTDIGLNENGKKQTEELSTNLKGKYDLILSSPLKRAKETAEIISKNNNIPIEYLDNLQERNFGVAEGKTWEEFILEYPDIAKNVNQIYQEELPEGESIKDVEERCKNLINQVLTKYKDKKLLIVTHTGIIRVLKRMLAGYTYEDSRKRDPKPLEIIDFYINPTIDYPQPTARPMIIGHYPVILVPGKHGFAYRELFPEIKEYYKDATIVEINNIDNPTYVDYENGLNNVQFNNNSIVVTHSLGGPAVLDYLIDNNIKIDKLIMLAPANNGSSSYKLFQDSGFFKYFEEYKNIKNYVNKVIIIYSDNDELIKKEDFEKFGQILDAEMILEPAKGHYATKDYTKYSEALDKLLATHYPNQWLQDPDVFDTWFSSGQWAFAPLMKEGLYDTFYPTSLMETAHDILELWVSRMIMLGIYRSKKEGRKTLEEQIPFKDVYLHGLIKAEDGQKMSKSKGNIVYSDQIINEYGADTLRLFYIVGNKAGAAYRVDSRKIKGYKNFLNKIWNASRFVLMNLEDFNLQAYLSADQTDKPATLLKSDNEIITYIDKLEKQIDDHMTNFRLGIAAEELHQSFWHTFCDKYIEEAKKRLYTKDKDGNPINTSEKALVSRKAAQYTLLYVLKKYLKLLHPIIPFITERIWQEVPKVEGELETIMY